MSGECDECGHHCLECICNEPKKSWFLQTVSIPRWVFVPAVGGVLIEIFVKYF